ncbi:MAG: restriction endonuclease subunit R, partial [Candidatus Aenigmatarchaeota archaeon]
MELDQIPLPSEFLDVFKQEGIRELYPPQEAAIKEIFKGKNLVVAIPTASGKTLIGYMAILRAFKMGLKSVYIVPLRALAMEKYEELKRFEKFGMRVALAMGDYDSPPGYLKYYDVIIATSEKMDSILRHDVEFAYNLGVVVVDEIHLLGEPSRGPTLEMVISKIRDVNGDAQIIALSATIKNSEELAHWLGAEHIYSEFRPVPLKLGVYYDDTLLFENGERYEVRH